MQYDRKSLYLTIRQSIQSSTSNSSCLIATAGQRQGMTSSGPADGVKRVARTPVTVMAQGARGC
jgi:hypothetical protein